MINNQLESKYDLVLFHINRMRFSEAGSVLNDIPNSYDLSDEQLTCYQRFIDLSEIVEQLHHDSLGSFTPDSIQSEALQLLANSDRDVPGSYARNILLSYHLVNYDEPLASGNAFKSSRLFKTKGKKPVVRGDVKIFPNPCRNYVTISTDEPIINGQVLFRIFDDQGRQLPQSPLKISHNLILVNLSDLIPGRYYLFLSFNGKKGTLHKIVHVK